MFEFSARVPGLSDPLFSERLDTFMDKCLADIRAFSEREHRPFEEIWQYAAEWHARQLFQAPLLSVANITLQDSPSKVFSILCDTSRALESLSDVTGVQSFVLAVDPNDPSDGGFLGGSVVGRDFWRDLRNGGEAGARTFKIHCQRNLKQPASSSPNQKEMSVPSRTPSIAPARSLKSDLYNHVRKALRTVSGIRNAEMKWTNPERLDVYGVRLIGWPPDIPAQNPSTLRAGQNKELLHRLEIGVMRFERIGHGSDGNIFEDTSEPASGQPEEQDDFSWAYDADGVDYSPELTQHCEPVTVSQPDHHASRCTDTGQTSSDTSISCSKGSTSVAEPSRKRPRIDSTGPEHDCSAGSHKSGNVVSATQPDVRI